MWCLRAYGAREPTLPNSGANYAFDVTPADLITAIVTEDRVIRPEPGAITPLLL